MAIKNDWIPSDSTKITFLHKVLELWCHMTMQQSLPLLLLLSLSSVGNEGEEV